MGDVPRRRGAERGCPSDSTTRRQELREDLVKVLFVVGLHPFTPDELIYVMGLDEDDNGGWVAISNADYFSRPLRLTPGQALGLIGAGEALLSGADPEGPLSRGLAKLAGWAWSEYGRGPRGQPGRAGR